MNIKFNREKSNLFFTLFVPLKTLESKTVAIEKYIIRANYGMIIGNFEIDFSDG